MQYKEKTDWFEKHIKGKVVLYLGCVDDDPENIRKSIALHKILHNRAKSILGVYHSKEVVAELNESGHDAVFADLELMVLDNKFEVAVSANVIEHVSNCGLFIEKVCDHLLPEGIFLVSTPNPIGLVRILELIILGRTKTNVEHTCWFADQVTGQLAQRYGLKIIDDDFIDEMYLYHNPKEQSRRKGVAKGFATLCLVMVNFMVCILFPQLSETFGFVLKRVE
jgi:SAM-dependent methyltransferase